MDSDKYYTDLLEKQSKELITKLSNERDAALAREDKLREALEQMLDTFGKPDRSKFFRRNPVIQDARAALSATSAEVKI